MRRSLFIAAIFLLAGAFVNVAVAWGVCDLVVASSAGADARPRAG